jgi:hypothetical protein
MQLSPEITPTVYRRNESEEQERVAVEEYEIVSYDMTYAVSREPISVLSEDTFTYFMDTGAVTVSKGKVFVNNGLYRSREVVLLREHAAEAVRQLADKEVVEYDTV